MVEPFEVRIVSKEEYKERNEKRRKLDRWFIVFFIGVVLTLYSLLPLGVFPPLKGNIVMGVILLLIGLGFLYFSVFKHLIRWVGKNKKRFKSY